MTGYVYLVHHPASGACKIGRSVKPKTRLGQIAPKSAGLALLASVPTGNPVWLERTLHIAFAHRHAAGEWFTLTDEEIGLFRSVPFADTMPDLPFAIQAMVGHNQLPESKWGMAVKPLRVAIPCEVPTVRKQPLSVKLRPEQRAQIVSTSVRAVVAEWLKVFGGGSVSRGLRMAIMEAYNSRGGDPTIP